MRAHALMEHAEYLDDSYLRLEQEGEIAGAYLKAMPKVSVDQIEDQELREQASVMEQENIEFKNRIAKVELELLELKKLIREVLDQR